MNPRQVGSIVPWAAPNLRLPPGVCTAALAADHYLAGAWWICSLCPDQYRVGGTMWSHGDILLSQSQGTVTLGSHLPRASGSCPYEGWPSNWSPSVVLSSYEQMVSDPHGQQQRSYKATKRILLLPVLRLQHMSSTQPQSSHLKKRKMESVSPGVSAPEQIVIHCQAGIAVTGISKWITQKWAQQKAFPERLRPFLPRGTLQQWKMGTNLFQKSNKINRYYWVWVWVFKTIATEVSLGLSSTFQVALFTPAGYMPLTLARMLPNPPSQHSHLTAATSETNYPWPSTSCEGSYNLTRFFLEEGGWKRLPPENG